MELHQCMCFLDGKKRANLLASLHNKFTCGDRTEDVDWPSPMARSALSTGRATIRKPVSLALYVRYGIERPKHFLHGWCIIRRLSQLGVWFDTMVAACGWANHVANCQRVPADPLPPPPVNSSPKCSSTYSHKSKGVGLHP